MTLQVPPNQGDYTLNNNIETDDRTLLNLDKEYLLQYFFGFPEKKSDLKRTEPVGDN